MAESLTMYDPSTGAAVQVDPRQAGELFRSGKATFAADQDVPVVGAGGRIQVLKGAQAGEFFQSRDSYLTQGATSAGALKQQQLQDEFGGVGGQLGTVAAGAARGASLGLSDAALTGLGLVDARTLAGQQEANPLLSGGSEVLGMLGAVAASGGTGGAARAAGGGLLRRGAVGALDVATAPTRAVMALGRGVEAGGAALLGEGTAARIATSAAQGLVEGSLFGVGQAVSEASVKDVPLTAERIMAAAGHGALLGGGLGAGTTALGAMLRGTASKLGDVGTSILGRSEVQAAELGGELAASTVPKAETTLNSMVDRYGREQAIKSSGANLRQIEKLQEMGQDIEQRVIKKLLDEAPEAMGKKAGALLNATEKAAAAERIVQKDGERIGSMIDDLSRTGAKADVEALVAQQRTKVASEVATAVSPDATREAARFTEWLDTIEHKVGKAAGGDVKALWEARRELRKDIDWKKPLDAGDRYNNWKRELYKSMGNEIEAAGTRAGPELGPDFAARWTNANRDYRASLWLEEATAKGAGREGANRVLGLSEQLGVLGGLAQGGVAALPMAVGGAVVQHLVKRYGSDVAARIARAATTGEAVGALDRAMEAIAGERVASLIGAGGRAVKGLPEAVPGVALAVDKATRREQPAEALPTGQLAVRFRERRDELTTSLATVSQRAQAATVGLDDVAPGLARAVQDRVQAASDFLASKLPKVVQRPSAQPHLERERLPSDSEMATYLRYERAVSDPLSVLDDAKKGRLRKEGAEALRAVYPTLYQALSAQTMTAVSEKKDRLTYQQRVQLSMLFPELPIDPSMQPRAIRAYQAVQPVAPSPYVPPAGAKGSPPRPPTVPFKPAQIAPRSAQIGA